MIFVKDADGKITRIIDEKPINSDIGGWTLLRYALELIFIVCAFLFIFYGLPVLATLLFGEM